MSRTRLASTRTPPDRCDFASENWGQQYSALPSDMEESACKSKRLSKGADTRRRVISAAFAVARKEGLSAVTLARLAETLSMSKSGVYAHCGSLEALHAALISRYAREFKRHILYPALQETPGIDRLRVVFERWATYSATSIGAGCLCISSIGLPRDSYDNALHRMQQLARKWQAILRLLIAEAVRAGQFRSDADAHAMVFEMQSLILAVHFERRFLNALNSVSRACSSFNQLLRSYATYTLDASQMATLEDRYFDDAMRWWAMDDVIQ